MKTFDWAPDFERVYSNLENDGFSDYFKTDRRLFIPGANGTFGKLFVGFFEWVLRERKSRLQVTYGVRNSENIFLTPARFWVSDFINPSIPLPAQDDVLYLAQSTDARKYEPPSQEGDRAATALRSIVQRLEVSVQNFVFFSSGAVYGNRLEYPEEIAFEELESPADKSLYARAKIVQEAFLRQVIPNQTSVLRGFAFSGPGVPLNQHFAIGNFVSQSLRGENILIRTEGKSVRSYLDLGDMLEWSLRALVRGANGKTDVYHLGSPHPISIRDLAQQVSTVAQEFDRHPKVIVLGEPEDANIYVPETRRTQSRLGVVNPQYNLDNSIRRMFMAGLAVNS